MNNQKPSLRMIVLIFFAVQLLLVSITFPISELLTSTPLFYIDNVVHWYRITVADNLAEIGNSIGYDPFFNAGTATGVSHNPAAKVPALLGTFLSPTLSAVQLWKLYAFAATCIAGVCAPLATGMARRDAVAIIAAGVFGLLLWWTSVFRWYHTAGMVSFVLASYMGLLFVGLIYRYLQGSDSLWSLLGLGLFGAAGMYVHPLFPLPVACWTLVYLALNWRDLNARRVLCLMTVVPVISLMPNLYWLYIVFIAEPYTTGIPGHGHQIIVDWNMIWMNLIGSSSGATLGSKMYSLLLLATIFANLLVRERQLRKVIQVFSLTGAICILYAAFGASIDVLAQLTQPNRFAPVGYLMLVVPAAIGTQTLISALVEKSEAWPRFVSYSAVTLLALLAAVNLNELRRELSPADIGHYGAVPPEVRPLGPKTEFMLDWLENNTEPTARILFETSNGRTHDGYHVAGYLATVSDREFIGGPYVYTNFANFTDGYLFGTEIDELPVGDFRSYVQRYNLGWIIAHSPASKSYFDDIEWLSSSDTFENIATYRVDTKHSYFREGSGTVAHRDHTKLVLDDLEGSTVVLKYHFMRGLKTEPEASLSPVHFEDDPNPLMKITDPPRKLTIYFE